MSAAPIKVTVLGSGTSMGVPSLACHCRVCTSKDPHDNRLRPSLLLSRNGQNVIIDTTPDFRQQALRVNLDRLDAILLTHGHADHILGFDDIRPFNIRQKSALPVYSNEETFRIIRRAFAYVFDDTPTQSTVPSVDLHVINGPFELMGLQFVPVPLLHGDLEVLGFRFGRAAYLTDFSSLPPASAALLEDLDDLVIDALRDIPHPMHQTVDQALALIEKLKPRRAWFTHIAHDVPHAETNDRLRKLGLRHVQMAYDGLQFDVRVATALTFDPSPRRILRPESAPLRLSTNAQRMDWFGTVGLEAAVVLPFTLDLARLSPEEFVEQILVRGLHVRAVLVGENFHFGHKQAGNVALLRELGGRHGFAVEIIPPVALDGEIVSSTAIRREIASGTVTHAARLLGRPFVLTGEIVPGTGTGRRYTFPTLNLKPDQELLPARGVYVTRTLLEGETKSRRSVTNVGMRPTFNGASLSVETHLLDFSGDITAKRMEVRCWQRLREEKKFANPEELRAQIAHDIASARRFFIRLRRFRSLRKRVGSHAHS